MRFEIWQSDRTEKWHARIVGGNNEGVWSTEADGYDRSSTALEACELLAEAFGSDLSKVEVRHLGRVSE